MTTQYTKKFLGMLNNDGREAVEKSEKRSERAHKLSKDVRQQSKVTGGGIIGKLRRWNITNNWEDCEPEGESLATHKAYPKSNETKDLLLKALKGNYLFLGMSDADLEQMIGAMSRVNKSSGDIIIRQGHKGTEFFVLEKGQADVFVNDAKVQEYGPGACFGELSLIYNAKRAATITATTNCTLWSLDLRTFRKMVATSSSSQNMARIEFLRRIPLLKNLSNEQISKLAGALTFQVFSDGEFIIRQGEMGNIFYLIKEGTVKCSQTKLNRETELLTLHAGDYFGEMALLLDEPRQANVVAQGPVETLILEKDNFIKLLGPLRDVLNRQMRCRVLKSVPLLSNLSDADLEKVANAMRVQQFETNQYIVREGEPGNRFYIISEGIVKCCKMDGQGNELELLRLQEQEYFGERALLMEEPRAASVIALSRVECLVLERSEFNALLGDVENILKNEVRRRENLLHVDPADPTSSKSTTGNRATLPAPVANTLKLKLQDMSILRTLGTGTFGRVKLAKHLPTGSIGALKCIQKAQIISCHQERNVLNEKNILATNKHPFIMELFGTFKDQDQIYMFMELVQGGELWVYIYERFDLLPRSKAGGFRKEDSQFYAACVVSAFEYIHSKNIAYRDLKPENLLVDSKGYLKVIDFGFAKTIPYMKNGSLQTKSYTICGTPEYLAPELVLSRGHDKCVDYWALGCLIYELLMGYTPFHDENQDEIFKKIIHSHRYLSFPSQLDNKDAIDLIRNLLAPNPVFRLGNLMGGIHDIKAHPFFNGVDWQQLDKKQLRAPYVPPIRDAMDVTNFDPYVDEEVVVHYTGSQSYFEQF